MWRMPWAHPSGGSGAQPNMYWTTRRVLCRPLWGNHDCGDRDGDDETNDAYRILPQCTVDHSGGGGVEGPA
eukprot:gene15853-biopygen12271